MNKITYVLLIMVSLVSCEKRAVALPSEKLEETVMVEAVINNASAEVIPEEKAEQEDKAQEVPALRDVPLEAVRYFEKIHWTEYYYDGIITGLVFHFKPIPPADAHYKIKWREKESDTIFFELLGVKNDSFFELDDPAGLYKNYWLPINAFGNIQENARKEWGGG